MIWVSFTRVDPAAKWLLPAVGMSNMLSLLPDAQHITLLWQENLYHLPHDDSGELAMR